MLGQKENLDDILNKFKLNQKYHIQLLLLIFFGYMTNTMHNGNFIFAFEEVKYRCVTQNTSQTYCTLKSNESCTEWIYDNQDSFVAEFDLACQDWKRTMVGTIHGFGYMCGLLLVGPISDRVGRKTATVITGTLGGVFGVLKSFSNWYIFYLATEFLEAAIGDLSSPIFVLSVEFVPTEKRTLFILLGQLGFTLGRIVLSLVAWQVSHMRTFVQTVYGPAFLCILYSFLLDESPRWLLTKGRKDSAIAVLEKMAKTNKTTLDANDLEKLTLEIEEKEANVGIQRTLQSKLLRNRLFVCIIWWTTATFVSYGLKINSVSLHGSKHLNFLLLALPEIPAVLASVLIMKRFKRKRPFIFCFFTGATFCLLQPFMPTDTPWLSNLIFIAGNVVATFYFTIAYLYTSELFPTYSRNSMHAFCSSAGRIGFMLAPQTPLLIRYWSGLPPMLFGLVSLIAGLVTFIMPEVGDDSLPDSVRQAEAVGKPNVLDEQEETIQKLL